MQPIGNYRPSLSSTNDANLLVASAISLAFTDAITTCLILVQGIGLETNEVLAELASQAIASIPVYIVTKPILLALTKGLTRSVLVVFFVTVHCFFVSNNIAGILTGNYFAADLIDYYGIILVGVFAAVFNHVVRESTAYGGYKWKPH